MVRFKLEVTCRHGNPSLNLAPLGYVVAESHQRSKEKKYRLNRPGFPGDSNS